MRKTVTAFVASLFCASAFAGLTQTEKDVFNTLVRDDINGAYNVYQTATFAMAAGGSDPIYEDVDVIEREFQNNELRANKKYKGKLALIEGRIDEVRVNSFNTAMVVFSSPQRVVTPTATFAKQEEQSDYIADFDRGQRIALLCNVDGLSVGNVRFSECQTVPYMVKKFQDGATACLEELEKGRAPKEEWLSKLIAVSVGVAGALTPEEAAAVAKPDATSDCLKRVMPNLKDLTTSPKTQERLKALGLTFPK